MVRNAFFSNALYEPGTMPREMALPIRGEQPWSETYDWWNFPFQPMFVYSNVADAGIQLTKLGECPKTQPKTPKPSISDALRHKNQANFAKKKCNDNFCTDPNLLRIIGLNGSLDSIKWNQNRIFYVCYNLVISCQIHADHSRTIAKNFKYYYGTNACISRISVSANGNLLAASTCEIPNLIILWNIESCNRLATLNENGDVIGKTINSMSFSCNDTLLAISGTDYNDKITIIIWKLRLVFDQNFSASRIKGIVLAKQHSEFHIQCLQFLPSGFSHEYRLVSAGSSNIRFWRIKEGLDRQGIIRYF